MNATGAKWLTRVALATAMLAVIGLFGDRAEATEIQSAPARPVAIEV